MIYFDSSALVKLIKPEIHSDALRRWRIANVVGQELVSSELVVLEISRTLRRLGVDPQRVPHAVGQALRGVFQVDLSSTVLSRARGYTIGRLGSLDAIHLATADPFRDELTYFVTYDGELSDAATNLGLVSVGPT